MTVTGGVVAAYAPGAPEVTFAVGAAVTAGQLVELTADMTVGPAGAASLKRIGIALQSGDTVGDKIAVGMFGDVYRLTASGAVTAGDDVTPAAAGAVSTLAAAGAATAADINNSRAFVGIALEGAANAGLFRALVRG